MKQRRIVQGISQRRSERCKVTSMLPVVLWLTYTIDEDIFCDIVRVMRKEGRKRAKALYEQCRTMGDRGKLERVSLNLV